MATPTEIINGVADDLERDDLIPLITRKFQQALVSAHSVENFAQDLAVKEYLASDLFLSNGSTSIDRPEGFRTVWKLSTKNSSGAVVDPFFYDQTHLRTLKDYFGYTIPRTFSQIGRAIAIQGISSNIDKLELLYLSYPIVSVSPVTGELTADSWILDNFPQIVTAYLTYAVAPVLQQDALVNTSQAQVIQYRSELISSNVDQLIGEPETWPVH